MEIPEDDGADLFSFGAKHNCLTAALLGLAILRGLLVGVVGEGDELFALFFFLATETYDI